MVSAAVAAARASSISGVYLELLDDDGAGAELEATRLGSRRPTAGMAVARTAWKGGAMKRPAESNQSAKGRARVMVWGCCLLADLEGGWTVMVRS